MGKRFVSIKDRREDPAYLGQGTMDYIEEALRRVNYVGNYLAIGDSRGSAAILNAPYIVEKSNSISAIGINKQPDACGPWKHMYIHHGDANSMTSISAGAMDVVLCCMMLEHDPKFWLTLSEVRRVLRQRGIFIVGVPVYLVNEPEMVDLRVALSEPSDATTCYRVHGEDYYRFSIDSIADILMEGFVDRNLILYGHPPRAICYGTKTGEIYAREER